MVTSARIKHMSIAILATLYAIDVNRDYGHFIEFAEMVNPDLDGNDRFLNPFERSLMMLADDFFDASWHGFETVGKLPTLEARALLEQTALAILNNLPINEEAVLTVFF
jgi:hypothetical protein